MKTQYRRGKIIKIYPLDDGISHIYFQKNYNGYINILCMGSRNIEAVQGGKATFIKWFIGEVRQWSIGAGHNSNCRKCLEIYLLRQNKNQRKAINNLINGETKNEN